MLNIAITTGEPAGIGPDITVAALLHLARQALPRYADVQWHVIGDAALLQARADAIAQGDFWRVASTAAFPRIRWARRRRLRLAAHSQRPSSPTR